jgi:hypothetical protein
MSKRLKAATEALTDAFTELVSAVLSDAGNGADLTEAMPSSRKAKADADDDEADPADRAKALKELAKEDLTEMARPDMKPYAVRLGVYKEGVKSDELRDILQSLLDKAAKGKKKDDDEDDEKPAKGKKKAAAKDDDDEDEPPAKKKKGAAKADDDDEDLPDLKTMKKDIKIFSAANKASILDRDPKFFSGKDAAEGKEPRLHQILADDELLTETWTDNVKELKDDPKAWAKAVAKAEAADEDDD